MYARYSRCMSYDNCCFYYWILFQIYLYRIPQYHHVKYQLWPLQLHENVNLVFMHMLWTTFRQVEPTYHPFTPACRHFLTSIYCISYLQCRTDYSCKHYKLPGIRRNTEQKTIFGNYYHWHWSHIYQLAVISTLCDSLHTQYRQSIPGTLPHIPKTETATECLLK